MEYAVRLRQEDKLAYLNYDLAKEIGLMAGKEKGDKKGSGCVFYDREIETLNGFSESWAFMS